MGSFLQGTQTEFTRPTTAGRNGGNGFADFNNGFGGERLSRLGLVRDRGIAVRAGVGGGLHRLFDASDTRGAENETRGERNERDKPFGVCAAVARGRRHKTR